MKRLKKRWNLLQLSEKCLGRMHPKDALDGVTEAVLFQIVPREQSGMECAGVMEGRVNFAVLMGAQTMLSREECALSMGQRRNDAAVMDAQI